LNGLQAFWIRVLRFEVPQKRGMILRWLLSKPQTSSRRIPVRRFPTAGKSVRRLRRFEGTLVILERRSKKSVCKDVADERHLGRHAVK